MTILDNLGKKIGAAKTIGASRARTTPNSAKLQFPTGEKIVYGMYFKFNKMHYEIEPGNKSKFVNLTTDAHIFLPLPAGGIVESMGINYQAQELGVAAQLMNAGANGAKMVKDNVEGTATNAGNIKTLQDVVNTAAGSLAYGTRKLLNETISGAGAVIDIKTGNVVNPYTLAMFQSVSTRVHNLTFRLIPRSQADSDMIRKIIRQFQYHSLPSRTNKFFLTMPDEVELAFYGTEKLFQFAPCVINSVQVNYSAFGTNSFFADDGSPVAIELNIGFQEIEALTRESYEAIGTSDAFDTK